MFPTDVSAPEIVVAGSALARTGLPALTALRRSSSRKKSFRIFFVTGFAFRLFTSKVENQTVRTTPTLFLRKEVIQPHLPIRLPCYDFTPVIRPAFGRSLLEVGSRTSGITNSHGVTGGVYKTRERIHRDMLIRDY